MDLQHRFATASDLPLLVLLNRQLAEDEGHRNATKSIQWFEQRMLSFLREQYQALLFELDNKVVAYVLYCDHGDHQQSIYVRQIFMVREYRRRSIASQALQCLQRIILPHKKELP